MVCSLLGKACAQRKICIDRPVVCDRRVLCQHGDRSRQTGGAGFQGRDGQKSSNSASIDADGVEKFSNCARQTRFASNGRDAAGRLLFGASFGSRFKFCFAVRKIWTVRPGCVVLPAGLRTTRASRACLTNNALRRKTGQQCSAHFSSAAGRGKPQLPKPFSKFFHRISKPRESVELRLPCQFKFILANLNETTCTPRKLRHYLLTSGSRGGAAR